MECVTITVCCLLSAAAAANPSLWGKCQEEYVHRSEGCGRGFEARRVS